MPARADLHLHSCHSVRPREWFFRRVGLPDSYSRPAALYEQLRARGMDFVTITDHDTIRGCLEIADRPGAFLSEQLTVHFPEDRVPVHLLVWGLDEAQHAELHRLHENLYDVQRYLAKEELAHAVAHPLYPANGHLGTAHLEKLALLFQHFEALNPHRSGLLNEVIQFMLQRLTPAKIEEFRQRHGLAPTHPQPWKKFVTAGSDDHGGVFPGAAYTATQACATPAEFLTHVRAGQCAACGTDGTPLGFSHGLYNNLRFFLATKFSA